MSFQKLYIAQLNKALVVVWFLQALLRVVPELLKSVSFWNLLKFYDEQINSGRII